MTSTKTVAFHHRVGFVLFLPLATKFQRAVLAEDRTKELRDEWKGQSSALSAMLDRHFVVVPYGGLRTSEKLCYWGGEGGRAGIDRMNTGFPSTCHAAVSPARPQFSCSSDWLSPHPSRISGRNGNTPVCLSVRLSVSVWYSAYSAPCLQSCLWAKPARSVFLSGGFEIRLYSIFAPQNPAKCEWASRQRPLPGIPCGLPPALPRAFGGGGGGGVLKPFSPIFGAFWRFHWPGNRVASNYPPASPPRRPIATASSHPFPAHGSGQVSFLPYFNHASRALSEARREKMVYNMQHSLSSSRLQRLGCHFAGWWLFAANLNAWMQRVMFFFHWIKPLMVFKTRVCHVLFYPQIVWYHPTRLSNQKAAVHWRRTTSLICTDNNTIWNVI